MKTMPDLLLGAGRAAEALAESTPGLRRFGATTLIWARTRRGGLVTACSTAPRSDPAERSVRGFLKWIGARWEETLAWQRADNEIGSVAHAPELMGRARAIGRRLIESPALTPDG